MKSKNSEVSEQEIDRSEEEQLVSRASRGDAQAFAELVRKYEKLVYNLSYHWKSFRMMRSSML